jgi:hypothetical protein
MLSLPHNVLARADLYAQLVQILLRQLESADGGFLDDLDMIHESDLLLALQRLTSTLSATNDAHLSRVVAKLARIVASVMPTAEDPGTDMEMDRGIGSDDDDEDEPLVVATDVYQASLQRIAAFPSTEYSLHEDIRKKYPLLAAAMTPTEDIVMACARVLDMANDVSLVREAAHYLEHVEGKRH